MEVTGYFSLRSFVPSAGPKDVNHYFPLALSLTSKRKKLSASVTRGEHSVADLLRRTKGDRFAMFVDVARDTGKQLTFFDPGPHTNLLLCSRKRGQVHIERFDSYFAYGIPEAAAETRMISEALDGALIALFDDEDGLVYHATDVDCTEFGPQFVESGVNPSDQMCLGWSLLACEHWHGEPRTKTLAALIKNLMKTCGVDSCNVNVGDDPAKMRRCIDRAMLPYKEGAQ